MSRKVTPQRDIREYLHIMIHSTQWRDEPLEKVAQRSYPTPVHKVVLFTHGEGPNDRMAVFAWLDHAALIGVLPRGEARAIGEWIEEQVVPLLTEPVRTCEEARRISALLNERLRALKDGSP